MLRTAIACALRSKEWLEDQVRLAVGYAGTIGHVKAGDDVSDHDVLIVQVGPEGIDMKQAAEWSKKHPDTDLIVYTEDLAQSLRLHEIECDGFVIGKNSERMVRFLQESLERKDLCEGKRLQLSWMHSMYFVPLEDIVYMERQLRKTNVNLADNSMMTTYQNMEDLLEQAGEDFVRVHHSCIVNSRYIQDVRWMELDMACPGGGKVCLPVSRAFSKNLTDFLKGKTCYNAGNKR